MTSSSARSLNITVRTQFYIDPLGFGSGATGQYARGEVKDLGSSYGSSEALPKQLSRNHGVSEYSVGLCVWSSPLDCVAQTTKHIFEMVW